MPPPMEVMVSVVLVCLSVRQHVLIQSTERIRMNLLPEVSGQVTNSPLNLGNDLDYDLHARSGLRSASRICLKIQ